MPADKRAGYLFRVARFFTFLSLECKMLIHAYRRKEAVTVDTGAGHVEFKPNAEGEVVGEANEAQAAVLLNIPEGYKAHGKASKPSKTAAAPAAAPAPAAGGNPEGGNDDETDRGAGKPFYLLGEKPEDDIDLGPMNMTELKAFAKANTVTVKRGTTEEELRKQLFDLFNTAE